MEEVEKTKKDLDRIKYLIIGLKDNLNYLENKKKEYEDYLENIK